MKINELRALIQEVIIEEVTLLENETSSKDKPDTKEMTWEELLAAVKKMVKNKKQAAQIVKVLKESLNENLNENEKVDEIFGFGEPATDAQLDAWLAKRPQVKSYLDKNIKVKYGEDVYNKWREFVKKKFKSNIKNDEAILNVAWDDTKKEWKYTG